MTKRLKINGTIIPNQYKEVYDHFGIEGTTPQDILNALPSSGEDVEIEINSYGGYVDAGNEIYTALLKYDGQVTTDVVMAGSAASIIAMAGDTVRIAPVGQLMIHNVASVQDGDYHDMEKMSEVLKVANSALANAYTRKTGKSKEDILELMDQETWLDADTALAHDFVDSIITKENTSYRLVASQADVIPMAIIKQFNQKQTNEPAPTMLEKFTNTLKGEI